MERVIYTKEEIVRILPHREPFLFVDFVRRFKPNRMIEVSFTLAANHPILAGHFPGYPLMPGVLITDALAQTSGLLWGFTQQVTRPKEELSNEPEIFFLAQEKMKYLHPVKPGSTLTLLAIKKEQFGELFRYEVEASVHNMLVAKGELTLAIKPREALL